MTSLHTLFPSTSSKLLVDRAATVNLACEFPFVSQVLPVRQMEWKCGGEAGLGKLGSTLYHFPSICFLGCHSKYHSQSLQCNLFFLGSGVWEFRLRMLERGILILQSLGIVPHPKLLVAFGILWLMEIITPRSCLCVYVQLCLSLRDTTVLVVA